MSDTATVLSMSVYASATQATLHTSLLSNNTDSATSASKEASSGDTVRISAQGQALALGLVAATTTSADAVNATEESDSDGLSLASEDDGDSSSSTQADTIQKQIDSLQEQIEEVEGDDTLTEEEKNAQVLILQSQIAQLEMQLQDAASEESSGSSGSMTALGAYGAST